MRCSAKRKKPVTETPHTGLDIGKTTWDNNTKYTWKWKQKIYKYTKTDYNEIAKLTRNLAECVNLVSDNVKISTKLIHGNCNRLTNKQKSRPGHPPTAETTIQWSYTSTLPTDHLVRLPTCLHGVDRDSFNFTLLSPSTDSATSKYWVITS